MKSTATAALASLKHKFNAKILEVGKLKNELKAERLGQQYGKSTEGGQLLARQSTQIAAQLRSIQSLELGLAEMSAARDKHCIRANSAERRLSDAKSTAENYRSLACILFVVGLGIGGLSYMAYIAQTI